MPHNFSHGLMGFPSDGYTHVVLSSSLSRRKFPAVCQTHLDGMADVCLRHEHDAGDG